VLELGENLRDFDGFFALWRPNDILVLVLPDRCSRAACSCDLSRRLRGVGEDGDEDEEVFVRVRERATGPATGEGKQEDCGREERPSATEVDAETGDEADSKDADEYLEDETDTVEMHDKRDDADGEAEGEPGVSCCCCCCWLRRC
jgi:hypothetical protein